MGYEILLSCESIPSLYRFRINSYFRFLTTKLNYYFENLHSAYFFCVGDAQNITTFSLFIIVMECEHTIEE